MLLLLLFGFWLSALFSISCAQRACPASDGKWAAVTPIMLDATVNYQLQFLVEGDEVEIVLSGGIDGFMGLGIPEQTSGSMLGADIVTVLYGNNGPQIRDRFARYEAFPFKPYASTFTKNNTSPEVATGASLFPLPEIVTMVGLTTGKLSLHFVMSIKKVNLARSSLFDENCKSQMLTTTARLLKDQ